MERRQFLGGLAAVAALPFVGRFGGADLDAAAASRASDGGVPKLVKAKKEWKKLLPAAAYAVLFEEDTERPFTSPLNDQHAAGTFVCAACFLPLFESAKKFDSGTGWPSFWQPIAGRLEQKKDYKLIVPRSEYHCARCGGHQGHVFDDGPKPTGLRYCNNGVALNFVAAGKPLPALRT